MKATIKLFKALPIKVKQKKSPIEELLKETIKRGFIFSPESLKKDTILNLLIGI